MRQERFALVALVLILVGLPLLIFGYQKGLRPTLGAHRVIDIQARAPENGGFSPESLRVAAGETVTLRFHSEDVTHGIAIGPGLGIDLGQIDPGYIKEVTVTFPEAGTYTFYCNTWCSDDHWRMRGVIQVGDNPAPAVPDPVIQSLIDEGIDIDAHSGHGDEEEHASDNHLDSLPSAQNGVLTLAALTLPDALQDAAWRFSHTPEDGYTLLAEANPSEAELLLRDAIAALWVSEVSPETVDLYNKNCAACHGQTGAGDGPAADLTAEDPPIFSDPAFMWEMRGDILYAKIRRGGMGTDMPNFGTLFTQTESRSLVDYLWLLAFGMDTP